MDPNLVILAGGVSSRMKKSLSAHAQLEEPLREDALRKAKSMIGVGAGARPFMDYVLWNARQAGYRDVILLVGGNDSSIREYYSAPGRLREFQPVSISYAIQPVPEGRTKPLGTADALLRALQSRPEWKGEKFTVCNSDNLYSRAALRALLETPYPSALIDYDRRALRFDESRIAQFAVIRKDKKGFLTSIIEKPTASELASASGPGGRIGVSMNIFRFSYDLVLPFLEAVPLHPVRQEKELPQAVMMMVLENPEAVMTIPLAEEVPDLTSAEDIGRIRDLLRKEFPDFSTKGNGG
jgi:NDP-sugar pyrophosphorylase family protein